MKPSNAIRVALVSGALAVLSTVASAATWSATSTATHSLWLSQGVSGSIGQHFDFDPAGLFSLATDHSGSLTGHVDSRSNSNAGFDVSFNFAHANTLTPAAQFKSENNSVLNSIDGFLLNMTGGTLIGTGTLEGLTLNAELMRGAPGTYAVQLGSGENGRKGANNKNENFGMAFWLKTTVVGAIDFAKCTACDSSTYTKLQNRQGDINIDLRRNPDPQNPPAVPLPASGLLVLAGMSALGLMRRRKSV